MSGVGSIDKALRSAKPDRLGETLDRELIQVLALRLIAGQRRGVLGPAWNASKHAD